MFANIGLYVTVSILTEQSTLEHTQALRFVDVFADDHGAERSWRASGSLPDLQALMTRFLGARNAEREASSPRSTKQASNGVPFS